ncbi:hypothetical protein N5853_05760 [Bartonella sp. HY329]|uniref:hypothetical protein n=1 Tax=unclassified Bartonella TaxID=2645622 RepID=UPI0021CA6AE0|nr:MULTISPECIES: hypothetical protein [unclassified Bartonella]UXM96120.1 hypothetical protein N5853_05760 [Bartonella sp. HY329]UXN10444.1 hypothetical protein N5852_05765 [Bartonella sp. HY328]
MKKIIYTFLALFIFNSSALANNWSAEEKNEMIKAFSISFSAFEKKDAAGVFALHPPKYIAYLAKEQNLEVSAFEKKANQDINRSFQITKSITYEINTKNNKKDIEYLQTAGGEKYAIINYTSYAIFNEGDKDSFSDQAVAVKIDGKWYFLERNSNTITILKATYPQFNDIKNP